MVAVYLNDLAMYLIRVVPHQIPRFAVYNSGGDGIMGALPPAILQCKLFCFTIYGYIHHLPYIVLFFTLYTR